MSEKLMTISELAKVFKINPHTIRHYEEKGIFPPSEISENRYRKYGLSEAYQLSFILFLRELGLSLASVKMLIDEGSRSDYTNVLLEKKAKIMEEKLRLEKLSKIVDEQIEISSKSKDDMYTVNHAIDLSLLKRVPVSESFSISDLVEIKLNTGLLMQKIYYIIHETFYDICIEKRDGGHFRIESGKYNFQVIEIGSEKELDKKLENVIINQGLPLIAIEDSERFLITGNRISIKVLGEKR
ncbi:MerR family transcriptional regulator [Candidatus Enterococcus ikei]|uniref:MerR family transcriptional regulator n=1 Tax=Candidatus Enterococcus ikei TaxID=2815326 RepID=A0ABS3GVJ6_9ENTE|nr:MerR family transcriptional regulator [Enterococcus sp. DIV0869a]MBO0439252.1 MerR family transcriptional regulator [Enterococcus sp. DIV0869a]